MPAPALPLILSRPRVRPWWCAIALALWFWGGAADSHAASIASAKPAAARPGAHHCRCSSDCAGDCCCVRRAASPAAAAAAAGPTESPPAAPGRRAGGPCVRSAPCGDHGIPAPSAGGPSFKAAAQHRLTEFTPRPAHAPVCHDFPPLRARLAAEASDEPPEHPRAA